AVAFATHRAPPREPVPSPRLAVASPSPTPVARPTKREEPANPLLRAVEELSRGEPAAAVRAEVERALAETPPDRQPPDAVQRLVRACRVRTLATPPTTEAIESVAADRYFGDVIEAVRLADLIGTKLFFPEGFQQAARDWSHRFRGDHDDVWTLE